MSPVDALPYRPTDEARLASCLGRAFVTDPLFDYILAGGSGRSVSGRARAFARRPCRTPSGQTAPYGRPPGPPPLGARARLEGTTWCMRQAIRLAAAHGHGYVVDDSPVAGAFWIPPGDRPIPSLLAQIAAGNWQAFARLGIGATRRILRREADLAARYRAHLREPCWILDVLGVDPAQQGRGLGGALLAPMLSRIDADNQSVYLVTYNPDNIGFYARFGFEVELEAAFAEGPVGWSMRRLPRGRA